MSKMTEALITIAYPSLCLTCEEQVKFGEEAWWIAGTGIWHKYCPKPRNLNLYISEAQDREDQEWQ